VHASALRIHYAHAILRLSIPLFRGFAEPLDGSLIILRHAFAILIRAAKLELCLGIAAFCMLRQLRDLNRAGSLANGSDRR
jgi:hypothetical protein